MSRIGRDLAHLENCFHAGQIDREDFRRIARELLADEDFIARVIGPDPEEIEEQDEIGAAA